MNVILKRIKKGLKGNKGCLGRKNLITDESLMLMIYPLITMIDVIKGEGVGCLHLPANTLILD